MDFSKLTHLTDSFARGERSATGPSGVVDDSNPLDQLEVREPIADSKKPTQVKMLILDDAQIKQIMSAPRDEKRKILGRLTDSQRRRVLTRFRELQKVKDDDSVRELALANLDSLINNVIYLPSDYYQNLLQEWTTTYQVPAEISEFVSAVLNNDRATMADQVDTYAQWCASNGIQSEINLVRPIIMGEVNNSADLNLKGSDEPLPDEEFEEFTDELRDSLHMRARRDLKRIQSHKVVNLTDSINFFAKHHKLNPALVADAYYKSFTQTLSRVADAVEDANDPEVPETDESVDATTSDVDEAIESSTAGLDDINDNPVLDEDGNPIPEHKTVMQAFMEALEQFNGGDPEALNALSEQLVSNETVSEAEEQEENSEEQEENSEEQEENSEEPAGRVGDSSEEPTGFESQLNSDLKPAETEALTVVVDPTKQTEVQCPFEKVENAAKQEVSTLSQLKKDVAALAKAISNYSHENTPHNKSILDAALDSVSPLFEGVNLRISDCCPCFSGCEAPVSSPLNPPLSRSEYYDMCPVCPENFDLVIASYPHDACPNCAAFNIQPNGVCVNPDTYPQMYYPFTCTPEELGTQLAAAQPQDYTGIINKNCCPMSDALHTAALLNNLSFIDDRFYKRHLNDSVWTFDEVPTCIKDSVSGPCSLQIATKPSDKSVSIYGVTFNVLEQ